MRRPASPQARLVLALATVLALAACAPAGLGAGTAVTADPQAKIHHASPNSVPLFARIVFTPATSYDQAVALLARDPYPWTCDDPATPTPPPPAALREGYAATHALLVSYPGWDMMTRLARSSQVVAVDGVALYQCA
jgi:hypothetical protein